MRRRSKKAKPRPRAWYWRSLHIRLHYSDDNGYVNCVTCGENYHYKEVDCGHYRKWSHKNTQYEFKNLAPQCKSCNDPHRGDGRSGDFVLWIERTFGYGTAELIKKASLMTCKRLPHEEEILKEEFKKLAKAEAEKRGIRL